MVRVIVKVGQTDKPELDYTMAFNLPEVPEIGDQVSIKRPGKQASEEAIVQSISWVLNPPKNKRTKIGTGDIIVGCARKPQKEPLKVVPPLAETKPRDFP